MSKLNFVYIFLFTIQLNLMAQDLLQGKYYYQRQEMVAAFNFFPDGRFEFFYSYGAIDRTATGTFEVEGDSLKLKSDKEAGHDFSIDKQSKSGSGYRINCHAPNPQLLRYMQCIAFVGTEKFVYEANQEGTILIDLPKCDKIYAKHSLFVDIPTLIKDENNKNNLFEITLQPSVQQLSFKGIDFHIDDEHTISCLPNYFMPIDNLRFTKE